MFSMETLEDMFQDILVALSVCIASTLLALTQAEERAVSLQRITGTCLVFGLLGRS